MSGAEYAIITQYDHTAFVDLSDSTAPVVVGTLAAPGQSIARDAKGYADYAFLTADNGEAGAQVFDMARLRDVTDPPVVFEADTSYTGRLGLHNFAVDEASGLDYFVMVDGVTFYVSARNRKKSKSMLKCSHVLSYGSTAPRPYA